MATTDQSRQLAVLASEVPEQPWMYSPAPGAYSRPAATPIPYLPNNNPCYIDGDGLQSCLAMSHCYLLTQSVVVYAHPGSIAAYQSGGPTQACQQHSSVLSVSSQFMPPPYGRNTPGSCTSNTTLEFRYAPDIVAGFGLMSLCPARAVATGFTTRLASGGSAGNDQRRRRA
eukprot:scpid92816/ scgid21822/ 